MADPIGPPAKRPRQHYHKHHVPKHKSQIVPPGEPAFVASESLDKLLVESIKQICEEVGLKEGAQDPIIESLALEAFTNAVDEYVTKLCSKVRRSMLAARRTVPIASDFETAFDVLDLPRPDDQLLPYRTKPSINPPLLPTPPPDDVFHNTVVLPPSFLGPNLSQQDELKKFSFNTASLPPLPSAHTYKTSAVFAHREVDSRRIRELATEEGKLGEQALRKLAGAVKPETTFSAVIESRKTTVRAPLPGPRRQKAILSEEEVFEETMRDLLQDEPGDFELGPVVTSEKAYRMPDDGQGKRRLPGQNRMGTLGTGADLVQPASSRKGKQKAVDLGAATGMDIVTGS